MNVDWAYNWGIEPKHDVSQANFEFVPMIWSASVSGVQGQIDRVLALEANYGIEVNHVLGFNEPELPTQANMTVQRALDVWDVMTNAFENTDIKMVSPSVSGGGARALDNWLYPFMDEVNLRNADADPANDLQVDAIAYHYYTVGFNATTEANKILTAIDNIWTRYQKPIWLTEFAGVNFDGVADLETKRQFNTDLLEILIPAFEARPYLERYAWWQFGSGGQPYSTLSNSSNGVFTPTNIGEVYSGTALQAGESYDFAADETKPTDVHYLKGATLTNTGTALATALRAIDALEGDNRLQGTEDWGLSGTLDAFVRVRTGATLRKQGGNTITLEGATVENHGALRVEAGTLALRNGTQVSGTGTLHADAGSIVSLGGATDAQGVRIAQPLELNGGRVQSNPVAAGGVNVLAGATTLNATTFFSGEGNLTVAGQITGGGGGFRKTGSGTVYLAGGNTYSGSTSIQGGKVLVANATGSATGASTVLVGSTGLLGGIGSISGPVTVQSGGSVAPGISQGNTSSASVPEISEGVVVDAIDFDFTGIQDDSPLTQTSTLDPAIELVSGFDFGAGLFPRNAANNGNEFNVAGFTNSANYGDAFSNSDYLTFTVAPAEGLAMVLDDVTYELRRNGAGAATQYRVLTSIDGFEWNAGLSPNLTLDTSDTSTHTFTAAYGGNEAVNGPVEVRVYGWGASSGFGNTHFYGVSLDASFVSDPEHVALQPTGILELGGDYTQLDFATLEVELSGDSNADPENAEFDQLQVAGDVTLDGTLDVSLLDGFAGSIGQTFDIITASTITGTFDTVLAPAGFGLDVSYLASVVRIELISLPTLPGDFNADGVVDAGDYTVWRDNFGSPDESALSGNGSGSNGVDQADYDLWATNFGSSSAISSSAATPEPSAVILLLLGAAGLGATARR